MALTLNGTTGISGIAGSAGTPALQGNNDANTGYFFAADTLGLSTAGSERLRVDSSGRLLIGTTASRSANSAQGSFQIEGTGAEDSDMSIIRNQASAGGPALVFGKSRNASLAGNTVVQDDDQLGALVFVGNDGTDLTSQGARIDAYIDGTPGSNDMPGRLTFSTTADGAASATERLRISSSGKVGIGTTNPSSIFHVRPLDETNFLVRNEGSSVVLASETNSGRDNNRGMALEATGFEFIEGGSEKMRIDSSGKMGIGTTSPAQLLHISAASGDSYFQTDTTVNGGLILHVDGTQRGLFANDSAFGGTKTDIAIGAKGNMIFRAGTSAYTERMRIDSSGNITAVNSASGGQSVTLKLGASNASGVNDGRILIVNGGTGNGVIQWDYENAANRAQIYVYRSTQDLIFTTAGSERMRLTSGETIAMGATSYGGGGANPILYLKSNSGRQLKIHNPDTGTTGLQLTNSGSGEGEDAGLFIAMLSGGGGYIKNNVNNADFTDWYSQVSGSQKHILKVYNDGKHGLQSNTDCLMLSTSQDGTGNNYFLRGSKNSTAPGGGNDVAWIYEDGDMYNANGTFTQSSDVALKENIVDANSQWADIKALKFRNFNFKASTGLDTHKQLGLVAQEVEPISPGLIKNRDKIVKTTNSDGTVTETIDGTTKNIKLSILYMKGMKALQEAMSRIETLEAKVTSLESA